MASLATGNVRYGSHGRLCFPHTGSMYPRLWQRWRQQAPLPSSPPSPCPAAPRARDARLESPKNIFYRWWRNAWWKRKRGDAISTITNRRHNRSWQGRTGVFARLSLITRPPSPSSWRSAAGVEPSARPAKSPGSWPRLRCCAADCARRSR